MRQTVGAIIAVSLLGAGCASLHETKLYNGPVGRTEIGAVAIAADPASSRVLVETYDGDLWIYDVDATVENRLHTDYTRTVGTGLHPHRDVRPTARQRPRQRR